MPGRLPVSGFANPVVRRYMRRHIALSLAYVAAVALASLLLADNAPADATTIGIALLPGLAVIGWLWAMARLLIELDDEYLRMLEVRKFLIATGITLAVCSTWGLVELFSPDVPRLPVFFVFPMWCIGLALGQLINRFAFGDKGMC